MRKQIHMNAFTQCCIGRHSIGQWKHPQDRPLGIARLAGAGALIIRLLDAAEMSIIR